jgi:hypothetical protein
MSYSRSYYASKFESEFKGLSRDTFLAIGDPARLPAQLLGDEDKGIEKGEEKNILYWAYL